MQKHPPLIARLLAMVLCFLPPGLSLGAPQLAGGSKELRFRVTSASALSHPDANIGAVKLSAEGDLLFLTSDRRDIHRFTPDGRRAFSWRLDPVLATASAGVQVKNDFATDAGDRLYVVASWGEPGGRAAPGTGVLVFDPAGRHEKTIPLENVASAERIAMDPQGMLYVLSLDTAWLRDRTRECYLVHKFTPGGKKVASFSPCPDRRVPGAAPFGASGSAISQLYEETARGQLWIRDGLVRHVLPAARLLRIFDGSGNMIREVVLTPPDSRGVLSPLHLAPDPAALRVWRVAELADGTFLIEWLYAQRAGSGGERRATFLALHAEDGRPLSRASLPPARPGGLIPGYHPREVLFLHLNVAQGRRVELLRATILLE